ncbi:RNI-like protein [Backusella circina FSU 941]|nr:RNI-like protein [Backusella circina FSU 941]
MTTIQGNPSSPGYANNLVLSPTTSYGSENFLSYSLPPPVPTHSSTNLSSQTLYTTGTRSTSNESTININNNGKSRSNSYFSLSGSSGYGSPEIRPFPVIPTTPLSEITEDLRPVFPPNEETKQRTYNLLTSTESTLKVIYAGDISYKPESGLTFITKKSYFVLSNNHLLIYKNAQKARGELDMFNAHQDQEQFISASKLNKERIFLALSDIYAVHTVVSDVHTFRVEYLHPQSKQSLYHLFTVDSSNELKQWLRALRKAIRVHLLRMETVTASERYNVVDRISKHNDTPSKTEHILMYKVVFKEKRYKVASTDQLKEVFLPVIFAIGKFSFYLTPVAGSDAEYKKLIDRERYGLLSIQSIRYENNDDTIVMDVRRVNKGVTQLVLSSSFCEEIIQHLRRSILSIVPGNIIPVYSMAVPTALRETRIIPFSIEMDPEDKVMAQGDQEVQCFHSTLTAYCASLNLNKGRFHFALSGPMKSKIFTLFPPNEIKDSTPHYTKHELLAILRSLQVNTFFVEINLSNISFTELESWTKTNDDGWSTTKWHPLDDNNVLSNEIYGILANTHTLRKLNLTNCKIGQHKEEGKSSAIAAIGVIMASGRTSMSRLCLGKNFISKPDMLKLVDGIKKHKKSMKELYLNDCGLETDMIEMTLETLVEKHPEQMMCLDLSSQTETLVVKKDLISSFIETFKRINVLRLRGFRLLSNSFTFNLEGSHLKEIDLGHCRLDDTAVARLCRWILSSSFGTIEALHLGKCNLNGAHVYDILTSITRTQNRVMFLNVENNPIMKEIMHLPKLFSAIRQSEGPAYLSFAKLDWDDSTLCEFFESLRDNNSIKFLDLSDIGLQYSDKVSNNTVKMMTSFFERNTSVKELKLNFELYKPGKVIFSKKPRPVIADTITASLRGFCNNTTIEKLDISGLGIEDPGALALAQVLRVNKGLKSISIDENNITIDGYRKIANSIEESAHQVVDISVPKSDMRNQLKCLAFRIKELIVSEGEADFFLKHTQNGEKKTEKRHELAMIIQERKTGELSVQHFDGVIQYLLTVVEKNRREKEELFNRNMEVQLQAQISAQELAITQRQNNTRPNSSTFLKSTFGHGVVDSNHDGSSSSTGESQSSSVFSDRVRRSPNRAYTVESSKNAYYTNNIYSDSFPSMSQDSHLNEHVSRSNFHQPRYGYSIYPDDSPPKSSAYTPINNNLVIDDPGFMADFGFIDDLDFDLDSHQDFNRFSVDQESLMNEENVLQNLHRNIYQFA